VLHSAHPADKTVDVNADQHYQAAARYLDEAKRRVTQIQGEDQAAAQEIQLLLQIAQVHATMSTAPAAQRIPPSYGQPGAPR
jgi:hypothetical protein